MHVPVRARRLLAICGILLAAALLLSACGCVQQKTPAGTVPSVSSGSQGTSAPPVAGVVTAAKPDASRVVITYNGNGGSATLVELQITVTDDRGYKIIQSMGSRLDTTPVPFGANQTIKGTFTTSTPVSVTGYYIDGGSQLLLDTTV